MRLSLSRLTLGTVQLGQPYGSVVQTRLPDEDAVAAILDASWQAGITCIDTHRLYGLAEERIGGWLRRGGHRPLVISKLPRLEQPDGIQVREAVATSLRVLGLDRLDGYLVHDIANLAVPDVAETLRRLTAGGTLGGFGASVYTPEEMARALAVEGVTMIQAPVSLLDTRLARSGLVAEARTRGVHLFARSVFAQGMLLADPACLPDHFEPVRPVLVGLRRLAAEAGVSLAALALHHVLAMEGVSSAVIGLFTIDQLHDNLAALAERVAADVLAEAERLVGTLPDTVLDPRQWPNDARSAPRRAAGGEA